MFILAVSRLGVLTQLVRCANPNSLLCLLCLCRHSIETLWKNLRETNPELLVDFEDFVSEIAEEVQGAQRALE